MMEPATAYFLKKYYPHVIKWWLVTYNPEVVRIWPSKAEKEEALKIEAKEKEEQLALEMHSNDAAADDDAFNATTGSYSGLYGKGPVDAQTQEALDAILHKSSSQNTVDSLLAGSTNVNVDVILPPEQDEIIKEANAIYERLLQEAAEDEAKKWAEIDLIRRQTDRSYEGASLQTS
ncbi:MAG: hypothetical protein HDR25_07290 [Lachnospiraceae bacterium]|nr:hypothetical protein [Lachnospiraceae bacterium]